MVNIADLPNNKNFLKYFKKFLFGENKGSCRKGKKYKDLFTLFTACRREGRRAERIRGEFCRHALAVMSAGLTHPVIASLDHPL
ncbi:hypothetical protein [Mucilaginibacter sp.]|uniref:hypothetical protein n=1 Tax=Mucilaginibacter sp. TaxID=1882438 RepID=UPI00283BBBBB|nr:hypothetical protein [Mucilaginibacter sp.]MDR3693464.1 hypothetical protein [Mucilaginibacter sp.]